jgi:hypothetical protein
VLTWLPDEVTGFFRFDLSCKGKNSVQCDPGGAVVKDKWCGVEIHAFMKTTSFEYKDSTPDVLFDDCSVHWGKRDKVVNVRCEEQP